MMIKTYSCVMDAILSSNSSNESTVLFCGLLWIQAITQLSDAVVQQEPCISNLSIFYEPQKNTPVVIYYDIFYS